MQIKLKSFLFFMAAIFVLPLLSETKLKIHTEKVLELGKRDLLFNSIASVYEDNQQNFYVLDRTAFRVYKFSPDGSLLLDFGNKGQGPGEFQAPHDIYVLENGNIAVSEDMTFVSIFDAQGHFIKRISTQRGLALTYLNENLFYAWLWDNEGRRQHLVDRDGTLLKTFFSVSREAFSVSAPDESGRRVMFNYASSEIAPSLIFNRFKSHMVVAVGDRYEFPLLNTKGQQVSIIKRDVKPQKLSSRERDYLLNRIQETRKWPPWVMKLIRKNMPKVKALFDSIRISENFVFVFRIRANITDKNGPYPVDIFRFNGEYTGTAHLEIKPLLISGRFMYAAGFDEKNDLILSKIRYFITH